MKNSPFNPFNIRIWRVLGLLVGAAIVLWPLLIVVWSSLQTPTGAVSWANYQVAWQQGDFPRAFVNSAIVAIAVTLLQIFTSTLAGYALARLHFWGKQGLLWVLLATLIVPFQILVIPIFQILKTGQLINTYGALILPTAINGFGIFLLRQYFMSIPIELEEAAALDGANRIQVLTQILLPLARPAVVTLSLFTFIGEWNDLFKPLVFTTRPELKTVQLALAGFQEQFTSSWGLMMAAVTIATVPVVGLFLLAQRQFIRGIAATGVKG